MLLRCYVWSKPRWVFCPSFFWWIFCGFFSLIFDWLVDRLGLIRGSAFLFCFCPFGTDFGSLAINSGFLFFSPFFLSFFLSPVCSFWAFWLSHFRWWMLQWGWLLFIYFCKIDYDWSEKVMTLGINNCFHWHFWAWNWLIVARTSFLGNFKED